MLVLFKEYYIVSLFLLQIIFLLSMFFLYKKYQDNKKINYLLLAINFISLITIGTMVVINQKFPLFEQKDCFTIKQEIINQKPKEEWHKDFLAKDVEYLILKVGKQNYYVHSSKPSLEDFPIAKDRLVKKTDCSIVIPK